MRRLVCEICGSSHYSASAQALLERGAACESCGGSLELRGEDDTEHLAVVEQEAPGRRAG